MQMEKNQMTKTFRNIEFFESLEVTGTQGQKILFQIEIQKVKKRIKEK